jgi:hypothetical protein
MKSAKCDRGFYKRRAELIDRVLFDRELTPDQRLVMLGIAAMTDPDTRQCDAGQTYLATALNVNRNTVITAMPKLAAEGYVLRAASDSGRREILTVTAPELAGSDLPSNLPSDPAGFVDSTATSDDNSSDSIELTEDVSEKNDKTLKMGRPRTQDADPRRRPWPLA